MIDFVRRELRAVFRDASGAPVERVQEVRVDPVTMKTCRITPSRALETERGCEDLYTPPPEDLDEAKCPFCPANIAATTPKLIPEISEAGKLVYNRSTLFPNLYPYTEWSAVSLFGPRHHVAIGTADPAEYRDSFINCSRYLARVHQVDPDARYMAITQNHLPGAGGSLVHPHLQVHATRLITNGHKMLVRRTGQYYREVGRCLVSDVLFAEMERGERYLGSTGAWEWLVAFAPSGFFEIWGIAPSFSTLLPGEEERIWEDLAVGVLNTQRFYRSLNRNAYNLTLLAVEDDQSIPCLKVSLTARSSYAPWVRSDFTGFELASGEMATFTLPETVAALAKEYWSSPTGDGKS